MYLNQGEAPDIDGVDDAEEFNATREAFKVQEMFLSLLTCILGMLKETHRFDFVLCFVLLVSYYEILSI